MVVTVIVFAVLTAVFFVVWKYYKAYQRRLSEYKKHFSEQIPKMTDAEVEARLGMLYDELEDNYSSEKVVEYEMLVAEYRKRRPK